MIPHCHVSTHLTTQHPLDPLALLSRTNFYLQDTIFKGWSEMESKYRLKILKKVYSQVAVQEKVIIFWRSILCDFYPGNLRRPALIMYTS